jgi:branched-chain amino acid transport system substrate-binding protein
VRARKLAPLLLAVSIIAACQGDSGPAGRSAPSGDIIIASDLSVSSLDGLALPLEQAIRLAIAQHPTIGRFKVSYWSLDDALAGDSSSERALQNVAQMVDDNRVLAMIGPLTSYVAFPTIPVANMGDLAMVSPDNTAACLTQGKPPECGTDPSTLRPSGRNNYFRIAPPDVAQGNAMGRYAARNLNVKRVAVINEWGPDGDKIISRFATELELNGGKIVVKEDVDSGTTDFKTFLANAQSKGAQAIYAIGDGDKICIAASQMSADLYFLGTDAIVYGSQCIGQALSRSGSMLATYTDVDITKSQDPKAMNVVRQFHESYPNATISDYTFAAYDCAMIVIDAIEQAIAANGGRLPDRRQVLDAMTRSQFTGVTGTYSFDKNGDAIFPLMSVYKVVSEKWTYLNKIDGSASSS